MRNVTNPSLAHLLPISFVNFLSNLWNHMLVLCGPTYSMVDLLISCMEMNTRCAKRWKPNISLSKYMVHDDCSLLSTVHCFC